MKKALTVLLALITACSIFSCDGKKIQKKIQKQQIENMESATEDFELGVVENGVYKSSFSNISFTAPEDWTYASKDDILKMTDIGSEKAFKDDAEMYKELASKTTVYDMMAQNALTGENIIILYENITAYGIDPNDYTIEQYLDNISKQITKVDGMTYTQTNDEEIALAGHNFRKITWDMELTEYNYKTAQIYYISRVGDYMMTFIVSAGLENLDVAKYESCFKELEKKVHVQSN